MNRASLTKTGANPTTHPILGRRIIVLGPTGSGKSTLAERLSALLKVPHVELDALHWKPGWVPSTPEELHPKLDMATQGEGWIVSGGYEPTRGITWPRADTVVWLDLPLPLALWRVITRTWRHWRSQELLWGTNREYFWKHLKLW